MDSKVFQRSADFIGPWLEQRLEDEAIPGLAVMISSADGDVWASAVGYADIEQSIPMTPDYRFPAASQTKTFTALATLQLAQAGVLRITDPVSRFVPEIMEGGSVDPAKLTIESLLTHTAGLLHDSQDSDYWAQRRPFPTTEDMLATIQADGIIRNQIGRMKYSNLGYALLALCLARASQHPYEDIIDEQIIQPLGLTSTGFQPTSIPQATGYGRQDNQNKRSRLLPPVDAAAYAPAAGIYSTLHDLSTFYAALGHGNDAVDPAISKAMLHPRISAAHAQELHYGYGIDIGRLNGRPISGHGGGYPGFTSKTITEQLHGLTVSAMTNCIDGDALHAAIGTVDVIDFFARNGVGEAVGQFNARASDIWRDRHIVASDTRIVSIDPHSWRPFDSAEDLTYVDDSTLRISLAGGFESEGELVHFYRDQIRYAGRTMMRQTPSLNENRSSYNS